MTKFLKTKRALSALTALCLIAGLLLLPGLFAAADDVPAGYVAFSVEANCLGAGYLYEPILVPFNEGESVAVITERFLGEGNFNANNTFGYYMNNIKLPRDITVAPPAKVAAALEANGGIVSGADKTGEFLESGHYFGMSGWMFTLNQEFTDYGADGMFPDDGDVICWVFSLFYGEEYGSDWFSGEALYEPADKSELLWLTAEINTATHKGEKVISADLLTTYESAYITLCDLGATQAAVDGSYNTLKSLYGATIALYDTLDYLLEKVPSPTFANVGGEWTVLALARAGWVPEGYFDGYKAAILKVLDDNDGILPGSANKKTEYARLALALTSIGVDITIFGENYYDLLQPLSDIDAVCAQGLNGAVFALLALDTYEWSVPKNDDSTSQLTREKLLETILDKELENGGFALSGTTIDADMTGMVLQAIAPYKDGFAGGPSLTPIIERAIDALRTEALPKEDITPEGFAQMIIGLTALGIDPASDPWDLVRGLIRSQNADGSFSRESGAPANMMATEQAACALTAYVRFVKEKTSFYDMTDVWYDWTRKGDVNDDGRVGIHDILLQRDHIFATRMLRDRAFWAADADNNKIINIDDILLIVRNTIFQEE